MMMKCDDQKIMMLADVLKNFAKRKKHITTIDSSIINDTDVTPDGIHLNEIGVTKLLEHIDTKMKILKLGFIIKEGKCFLANRPYSKVAKKYIFGCKKCSEAHDEGTSCPPISFSNGQAPQQSQPAQPLHQRPSGQAENFQKRTSEAVSPVKGVTTTKLKK